MRTFTIEALDDAQIRGLTDARIKAINQKDIDNTLLNYAWDTLSFDVVDPQQHVGSDTIRKRLEEWFSSFEGFPFFEMSDLKINAVNDMAFCHSITHIRATKKDGGKLDMWWRETIHYRRINGKWLITHLHSSVPYNIKSGKASLDLTPTAVMGVSPS